MAGLWDIVWSDPNAEFQKRLNVSLLETELTGLALGVRTRAQALTNLSTNLGRTLTTSETNDLSNLADQFQAGSTQSKLVYFHKTQFALNAAELNLITEAEFRTVLGI